MTEVLWPLRVGSELSTRRSLRNLPGLAACPSGSGLTLKVSPDAQCSRARVWPLCRGQGPLLP